MVKKAKIVKKELEKEWAKHENYYLKDNERGGYDVMRPGDGLPAYKFKNPVSAFIKITRLQMQKDFVSCLIDTHMETLAKRKEIIAAQIIPQFDESIYSMAM